MKLALLPHILEKYSNIKFRENPSSGSLIIPWDAQDGQDNGQTDMTKLIVASHNLHAPKISPHMFLRLTEIISNVGSLDNLLESCVTCDKRIW
jgi:hypothetical protein